MAGQDEGQASTGPATAAAALSSTSGGTPCNVYIWNETGHQVVMLWLDYEGKVRRRRSRGASATCSALDA